MGPKKLKYDIPNNTTQDGLAPPSSGKDKW
jgi:hypothetical protein